MFRFSWSTSNDTTPHAKEWLGNKIPDPHLTCYLIEEVVDANGYVDDRVSILGAEPPAIKPIQNKRGRILSDEQHEVMSKFFRS